MAKKVFVRNNYLIVSDLDGSNDISFPRSLSAYQHQSVGNYTLVYENLYVSINWDNARKENGDAYANEDEFKTLLQENTGGGGSVNVSSIISDVTTQSQGYYGLLSSYYFGGDATETEIAVANVDQWIDVEIDINGTGLFDNRPQSMVDAQPIGHEGDGTTGNPIVFKLEGLNTRAFCNFRASMSFDPDEDEGQLESRLLFNRHSGALPINDFPIEEVSLSMQNGADKDYVSEPMLSFFIGDTIDTNAVGDAGKCRFQIKSNVAGTLKVRALTWYINK